MYKNSFTVLLHVFHEPRVNRSITDCANNFPGPQSLNCTLNFQTDVNSHEDNSSEGSSGGSSGFWEP